MRQILLFIFLIITLKNAYSQVKSPQFNQSKTNFIENKGQLKNLSGEPAKDIKFVLERAENKVFLHENSAISFQINIRKNAEKENVSKYSKGPKADNELKPSLVESYRMDMQLLGANPNPTISTEGKSADYINYFNHSVSRVHHYQKVIYENVYPDIDWIVYTTEKGMKYDFYLRPGADPALIKIKFNFQDSLYLNELGQLVHSNPFVRFIEDKPKSFQDGKEIETSFVLNGDILRFQLADYDKTEPLTIDPDRVWSTYYGGVNSDFARAVTTDASGSVYMCGQTESTSGIATPNGLITNFADSTDAFVVKFDRNGVRQWATYFGFIGEDYFTDVKADQNGYLYLCGVTTSYGMASIGQMNYGGGLTDAFLLKMDTAGAAIWSTYIGGESAEFSPFISISSDSFVYVGGETQSITNIDNGGFQTMNGFNDGFLFKFNNNGVIQWSTYLGGNSVDAPFKIQVDKSNNIYLVGSTFSTTGLATVGQTTYGGGIQDGFIVKISPNCQLLWSTYFGGNQDDYLGGIAIDNNNNVFVSGTSNSTDGATYGFVNVKNDSFDTFIAKYDSIGNLQWAKYFGGSGGEDASDLTISSDAVFLVGLTDSYDLPANQFQTTNGGQYDCFVSKFDFNGNLEWGTYLGGSGFDNLWGCTLDNQNNLYICGGTKSPSGIAFNGHQNSWSGNGTDDAFLSKFTTCFANISGNSPICIGDSSVLTVNQAASYQWSGGQTTQSRTVNPTQGTRYEVTTTDAFGCTATDFFDVIVANPILSGAVVIDSNANCMADLSEPGIIGTMIQIDTNGTNYFTNTIDHSGNFQINLRKGSNIISAIPPNPYWQICNISPIIINDSVCATYNYYYAMSRNTICPLVQVDIAVPILRKTQPSSYFVNYCNQGTIAANNALVSVTVDTFLEVLSTSIPIVSQNGNVYTFNVGNPEPGDCGTFSMEVIVKLSAFSGQTHCTYVSAAPDTICIPNIWNGAFIESSATCQNDTVFFTMRNKGADMLASLPYTVYMDSFIVSQGSFQLTQNTSFVFAQAADSGKCYRIIASQESGFPSLLGDSSTTVFIENCNTAISSAISRGFGLQFENGNSAPNKAVDCTQNLSAYDPNDKRGQPVGYSSSSFIYQNSPMDYTIRFQNTGSDTAFNVVVTDTLSNFFDISSIEMGAASHTYTWQIKDGNVLRVSFNNIMLPDSTTNEPLSNGFFKFRIQQQENNPLGTLIENQVAIFFDFEPPVLTNKTQHRVGRDFDIIFSSINLTETENPYQVNVFPNPFTEQTNIQVEGNVSGELNLIISDLNGRTVENLTTENQNFILERKNLNQGIYFFRILNKNKLLASGKLLVK